MPDISQTEADSYPEHFYTTKCAISGRDVAWKISTRSNLKWPITVKKNVRDKGTMHPEIFLSHGRGGGLW